MVIGKIKAHTEIIVKTMHNPIGMQGVYTFKTPVNLFPGSYVIDWDGTNDPTFKLYSELPDAVVNSV